MKHLSLCTGYGGLDLAIESKFGSSLVAMSEFDPKASLVCETRFPSVPNLGDLKAIDWASIECDIITAGYPCQPFSVAGKRLGENDDRHLWPFIAEGIRTIRPEFVFLENVPGHRSKGFGRVLGDLAEIGYDARWTSVRASDIGAPHRRERVFILAHPHGKGWQGRTEYDSACGESHPSTHSDGLVSWGAYAPAIRRWELILGRPVPSALNDKGALNPVFVEWMMGLPEGWVTDVKDGTKYLAKTHCLKILGNGVVPQQASRALDILL